MGHLMWACPRHTDIQDTGTFSEITVTFDSMRKQSLCPWQVCVRACVWVYAYACGVTQSTLREKQA